MTDGAWLQVRRQRGPGKQLLCFPPSGGTATSFATWVAPAKPDFDVVGIQFPGRGVRMREPQLGSLDQLLDAMVPAIGPHLEPGFDLLGYCLGGIIAYELARRLATTTFAQPAKLIVCSCGAPDTELLAGFEDLSDAALVEQLRRWGGMTEKALANRQIIELTLPPLRADLHLLAAYRHAPEPRLAVPIVALYGEDDDTLGAEAVRGWERCTSAGFTCTAVEGAHFPAPERVLEQLRPHGAP